MSFAVTDSSAAMAVDENKKKSVEIFLMRLYSHNQFYIVQIFLSLMEAIVPTINYLRCLLDVVFIGS
ncbi:hypothetical protein D9M71_816900 [compost metagenome]